jgi:hypothetical protein
LGVEGIGGNVKGEVRVIKKKMKELKNEEMKE